MSLHVYSSVTLGNVAVLANVVQSDLDSYLNIIFFVLLSGAVSPSHVDVAFNVLDLSVADTLVCSFPSSPLSSTWSSSDHIFHFHHLIPVPFFCVLYNSAYEYVVDEV